MRSLARVRRTRDPSRGRGGYFEVEGALRGARGDGSGVEKMVR